MKVKFLITILILSGIAARCQRTVPLPGGVEIKPSGTNIAPVANAGSDQVLTSGATTATLTGSGTDVDGSISTYNWTQQSGPNTAGITTPSTAATGLTGMITGTYVFRLTVTDNRGATAYDEVSITIPSGAFSDTLYLYISAGQSNMDGRANTPYPYATVTNTIQGGGVMVWDWKTTLSFKPFEYDRYNGGQTMSTPQWAGDIIVMKKIYDSLTGVNSYFMKATLGGSSLAPFTGAVGCWTVPQDSVPVGKPRMLDSLVKRLNDVRTWAAAQSTPKYVKVVALMWHQGESDQGDATREAAYQYRLERVFDAIRDEVGNANLPIVLGTVSSASVDYSATIHTAHVNIANADANIYLIELDGQPLKGDNLHFNVTGQTYFGDQLYSIIKNFAQ